MKITLSTLLILFRLVGVCGDVYGVCEGGCGGVGVCVGVRYVFLRFIVYIFLPGTIFQFST